MHSSEAAEKTLPLSSAAARGLLAERRRYAQQIHERGATGSQIGDLLTQIVDEVVRALIGRALGGVDLGPGHGVRTEASGGGFPVVSRDLEGSFAVVALGGYGRREMAPYSDVDLLFLYAGGARARVEPFAARLMRDLWDAGLQLGHAVRTVSETLALARREVQVATALIECRFLAGAEGLAGRLERRFLAMVRRRWRRFVPAVVRSRAEERARYGSTVHLLEPDLKCSPGGLRDLHLLRWVGLARYGEKELEALRLAGVLLPEDARVLATAQEFLLRIRADLHFRAGKAQDVLTREEQVRLAGKLGFAERGALLPAERFMQAYFRHTKTVASLVDQFVERAQPRSLKARLRAALRTRRVDGVVRVGPERLSIDGDASPEVVGTLEGVLRIAETAQRFGVRLAPEAIDALREAAPSLPRDVSPEAARRFVGLLDGGGRVAGVLRLLHESGVLSRLIPAMEHATCLLQFNQYHKYTVDEHCLLAVELAEQFEANGGPLGEAYRQVPHKAILRLALLLHDLGKGYDEDHSDVGRRIARETAARLQLDRHAAGALEFLVHRHLRMSHIALRRDVSDEKLLLQFVREVGTPEMLNMLYVLTAADIAAVGPGAWTQWKDQLLGELYARALEHLSGERPAADEGDRLATIRAELKERLALPPSEPSEARRRLEEQIEALAAQYLLATPPDRIVEHLRELEHLEPGGVHCRNRYVPELGTIEQTVFTFDDLTPGIFYKLAGTLSAKGLEILGAQISTHANGVVIDTFQAVDRDFGGCPPRERLEEINRAIRRVLLGELRVENLFAAGRRYVPRREQPLEPREPTRVLVDNETSDRFTIVEVFTHDRPGLLYTIARKFFELGISISLAKIATRLDQVVDVFYVTREGRKLQGDAEVEAVRGALYETIEAFEPAWAG